MSRCFPFPPPGYERKIKADDLDLLKKEKHREKKHKKEKEKKDKEKKESKEKQEKEKTDEKHREKKDKKEKHRDKKKDRDRDRDKDKHKGKSLPSDEKRTTEPPDIHLCKSSDKGKDRKNDKIAIPSEKRVGVSAYNNGVSFAKNNHVAPQTKGFNSVPELGRRSTVEERRTTNQLFDKNIAAEPKKEEGVVKIGWKNAAVVEDGKEKAKEKSVFDGRMDSLLVSEEARFSGNALGQHAVGVAKLAGKSAGPLVDGRERADKTAIVGKLDGQAVGRDFRSSGNALPPNSVGLVQKRVGAMARPVEKKFEQKVDGKEKIRDKKGDDRKGEKRKEKDREKRIQKDKDREKEKKKEEKVSDQPVQMGRVRDGSDSLIMAPTAKDDYMKDFSGPQNIGIQNLPKTTNQGGDSLNTILGKRKDGGLNGIYDEHMSGPNKLARTTASTPPLVENGRSLEASQKSAVVTPGMQRPPMNIKVERTFAPDDTQRPPMNIKVDGKEHKSNGINTGPLSQLPQAVIKAQRKSDVPVKPHPDAKYLDQILSVPKMDEWSESDDQDWLFSHNGSQPRPEAEPSLVEETSEVWAKALWLPPVDMFALPYVIPH